MDISEVWVNLGYFVAPVAALVLVLVAFRIRKVWIRVFAVCMCMILLALSGLALFLDGSELMQSTVRRPGIISPNGKYVAVTRWFLPGAVGQNYVHVFVRSRFSPIASEVDSGPADPPDVPQVRWLDDQSPPHYVLGQRTD